MLYQHYMALLGHDLHNPLTLTPLKVLPSRTSPLPTLQWEMHCIAPVCVTQCQVSSLTKSMSFTLQDLRVEGFDQEPCVNELT